MGETVGLNAEQVVNLKPGQRILFSDWSQGPLFAPRFPAMVAGCEGRILHYIYVGENFSAQHGQANLNEYEDTWLAEVDDGFFVETPEGMLHAYALEDVKERSVAVELCRGDHDVPIQLARTSYLYKGSGELSTRVWPDEWHHEGRTSIQHKGYNS